MGLSAGRARVRTLTTAVVGAALRVGLFALSVLTPRDEALWVFGSNGGEAFSDNSKYLFQYTAAEREHIRVVWLSRSEEVVKELRDGGYEAYRTDSFRGRWTNLRAGTAFVSHGMPDVNRWCSGGARTVVLWHGVALKRIGWDGYKRKQFDEKVKGVLKESLFDRYDWLVVPSEAMVEPFSSAFHMSPDRILPLGYPRNDALTGALPNETESTAADYEEFRELHGEGVTILYAPTKHPETGRQVADHLRLAELDDWLVEHEAHLLLKPHPAEPIDLEGGFSRIVEVPQGLDVYPLLEHADVLLTDYSSLFFDYLLLDRPVAFYPFDLEEYRSTRGFYLDYERVTPGPVATEFDALLDTLDGLLDNDGFAPEREAVRGRFLQPASVGRCEAVCDRFDPESASKDEGTV